MGSKNKKKEQPLYKTKSIRCIVRFSISVGLLLQLFHYLIITVRKSVNTPTKFIHLNGSYQVKAVPSKILQALYLMLL